MPIYTGGAPLLLHMDGAEGATTFTDDSPVPRTLTPVGGARISTAQSKFGGASAYFDGNGSGLLVPNSVDLNVAGDNFTIEGWVYFESLANSPYLFLLGTSATNLIALHWVSGTCRAESWRLGSGGDYLVSSVASATSVWEHWALTRVGGLLTLYKNGVSVASYPYSPVADLSGTSVTAAIGYKQFSGVAANHLQGYVDEVRVTAGLVYTGNFTPPTLPFPTQFPVEVAFSDPGAKWDRGLGAEWVNPKPVLAVRDGGEGLDRIPLGIPQNNYERGLSPASFPMQFKGRGRITGTVKEKASPTDKPIRRRVRLYREPDGLLVQTVWSHPATGVYEFYGIPLDTAYTVISHDYQGLYRAVLADNLAPELIT